VRARTTRIAALAFASSVLALAASLLGAGMIGACPEHASASVCLVGQLLAGPTKSPVSGSRAEVGPTPSATDEGFEGLSVEPMPAVAASAPPTPAATPQYTFRDEFDGDSLGPEWGRHWQSLGQAWPSRTQTSVGSGVLTITARRAGAGWTSDLVDSFGTFRQRYGYFEARIRIPQGTGLWPAFWLAEDWAASPSEIDIMEVCANPPGRNTGGDVTVLHQIIHGTRVKRVGGMGFRGEDLSKGWHTYAIDWRRDHIIFYFDGVETWRYTDPSQIPGSRMTVIASLAVGGWCGPPDASTPSVASMQVDWIRVRP
jgi:beta-glucanase (GH16 family)